MMVFPNSLFCFGGSLKAVSFGLRGKNDIFSSSGILSVGRKITLPKVAKVGVQKVVAMQIFSPSIYFKTHFGANDSIVIGAIECEVI